MSDILKLIDSALAEGFADEELSDMISAIQNENIERMERRIQTFAAFSGKPTVLLNNEPAWDLGNRKYAIMTPTGAVQEIVLSPHAAKPQKFK